jgi:hypothetical protein
MNPHITAIIVTWNSAAHIGACLEELAEAGLGEVIVVDNASLDATRDIARAWPDVTIIANGRNLGYTAAVNQGVRAARTPFVLILNPDVRIGGEAVGHLARELARDVSIALIAPRLEYPDGILQYSCRSFPNPATFLLRGVGVTERSPWMPRLLHRHLMTEYNHEEPRDVDWALGACLLARRDRLAALRYLDERYFLYYSDIDLCFRIRQAGWKVRYEPRARATHAYGRASARVAPWHPLALSHARGALRFFYKRLAASLY